MLFWETLKQALFNFLQGLMGSLREKLNVYSCEQESLSYAGFNILHLAVCFHPNAVKSMLSLLCDNYLTENLINEKSSYAGMTPLHLAAMIGDVDVVKQLLKHEANPLIENDNGEIPLHLAESPGVVSEVLKNVKNIQQTPDQACHTKKALSKFIKANPLCTEAIFDHCIGTNGKDEDSKDLLITFDLSPFIAVGKSNLKEDQFADLSNMVQK